MKKKVGVTDSRSASMEKYLSWFTQEDIGGDIEIVKLEVGSHEYNGCSGIVLTGGTDVHPDQYDGSTDYPLKPESWDEERDVYEEKVYKYAKYNKLPVLAICRGMQLVNVIEGGTLIQDLGEGNVIHKKEETDKEHPVTVDSRTLLGEVTGAMTEKVNSAHHQAIDLVGNDLMVSAVSKDDVIEGLEFKNKANKGFMVGVQWHPERMTDKETSLLSKGLKKAFLSAIRSFSK
ncbi:MAG TPA: gamma-glutamyl-gamma-aminobutyrate hydrolase family protein [Cyclobacteriaceae bacterium]|nr:gamma-glutamyl-gamma-aminobutyrate hydrolase family protein [Cyclobacteriaceae bacterium]